MVPVRVFLKFGNYRGPTASLNTKRTTEPISFWPTVNRQQTSRRPPPDLTVCVLQEAKIQNLKGKPTTKLWDLVKYLFYSVFIKICYYKHNWIEYQIHPLQKGLPFRFSIERESYW